MNDLEMTSEMLRRVDRVAYYLKVLKASGNYYERRAIAMNDLQLEGYLNKMRPEILALPIDALACEMFLHLEDERRAGLGPFRRMAKDKDKLVDRYRRYMLLVKDMLAARIEKQKEGQKR